MRTFLNGLMMGGLFLAADVLPAQTDVLGKWRTGGPSEELIVARYDNASGKFAFLRTSHGTPSVLTLGYPGATSIARVPSGANRDIILLCGSGPTNGSGWVAAVAETGGVFDGPALLWGGAAHPHSIAYSAVLSRVIFIDRVSGHLYSAAFDPSNLSVGSWTTHDVNVSATTSMADGFTMTLIDDPQQSAGVLTIQANDAPGSRMEVVLTASGVHAQAEIAPMLGAKVGICNQAVVNQQKIHAFGPPGTVVEAVVSATAQTIGIGVVDGDGFAEIDVTGMNVGDQVLVRDLITGSGTGATRSAYRVIGEHLAGPTGVTPLPFGSGVALILAGDAHFRVFCHAKAPASAPAWLPGVAAFGFESNVVFSTELSAHVLVGGEVIMFPAGMTRDRNRVVGYAPVPIPASAQGLELCIQWAALDGAGIVLSNIACVKVCTE